MTSGYGREGQPARRTVLYIEDQANNIALVQRLLQRSPHTRLLVARNGRDGVQAARDRQPALILLDNRLPDTTGRDVLRQLSSSAATAGIPVIIVSGDSGKTIAHELLDAGAAAFLEKPFDIHQFMTVIDHYLQPPAGQETSPPEVSEPETPPAAGC